MDATTDPVAALQTASATAKRGVPRLEQPKPVDEGAARMRKLEKAASDFESIFLAQLLKPLAKSVSSGSQLGGDVMVSVAMEKMAEALAEKGGIGLGDLLFEHLKYRVPAEPLPEEPQDDSLMPLEPEKGPMMGLSRQGPPTPIKLDDHR